MNGAPSLWTLFLIRVDLWRLGRVIRRIKKIEARRRRFALPFSHRVYPEGVNVPRA